MGKEWNSKKGTKWVVPIVPIRPLVYLSLKSERNGASPRSRMITYRQEANAKLWDKKDRPSVPLIDCETVTG